MRALYEDSVVPVREIARMAGVTERTLYKYVQKGGWRRRHATAPRDAAHAAANFGRRLEPAEPFKPVKGAGGRFIRREDRDKPHARGIKALDPSGAARASEHCVRAGLLSDKAAKQAVAASRLRARRAAAEKQAQTRQRLLEGLLDTLGNLARARRAYMPRAPARAKRSAGGTGRVPGEYGRRLRIGDASRRAPPPSPHAEAMMLRLERMQHRVLDWLEGM